MNDAFAAADAVVRDACGTIFTAAVARIEYGGGLCFERAYGATRADASAKRVFVDTRFDLASLTKLFVATIVLRAAAEGRIALDESLAGVFPEWRRTQHAAITPRMLLAHCSGMNSGADYRLLLDRNVVAFALCEPLVAAPRERTIYSDLGFIVLGVLLERIYGCSLATLTDRFFDRSSLGFRPRATERLSIPATEDDGWRGRVQGSVHDEKAHLMGGVAGHAGLFGTAADVAYLTRAYLGPLCSRENGLLPVALVREGVREQAPDPVLRRGLGWALKTSDENSCGRHLSEKSFGHTGFVGTCVWADPERDLLGVLLTNSIYFGRNDTKNFRAAFYEAAALATQRIAT
jgi:CubicO group peptidase (beta-lactamase class C family)